MESVKTLEELEKNLKDTTTLVKGALSVFIIFFPILVVSSILSHWL